MGNQNSPHKSHTLHSFPDHSHDVLSISTKICEGRSSNSVKKYISSSDEQLISDLRHMNMVNELKREKDEVMPDKSLGIPTVFRWHGKGDKIYISGSFNNWSQKILMKKRHIYFYWFEGFHMIEYQLSLTNKQFRDVKEVIKIYLHVCFFKRLVYYDTTWSHNPYSVFEEYRAHFSISYIASMNYFHDTLYYTIFNCFPGHQSYKFLVNGEWVHDSSQPTEMNSFGTLNNWLEVVEEDYNIDLALSHDEKFSKKNSDSIIDEDPNAEYGQIFPKRPNLSTGTKLESVAPSNLPPYLNDTVLNLEDNHHNDPNLLRTPVYVQINHMYASSITSGIAALSVTIRYRTKFITTVFYKPIS